MRSGALCRPRAAFREKYQGGARQLSSVPSRLHDFHWCLRRLADSSALSENDLVVQQRRLDHISRREITRKQRLRERIFN